MSIIIADFCQEDRAFQCYDGTCIPHETVCDSTVDCLGQLKEDESLCVMGNIASCKDLRMRGFTQSGRYTISPLGIGKY